MIPPEILEGSTDIAALGQKEAIIARLLTTLMQADFEQPKFYTLLLKRWGITD